MNEMGFGATFFLNDMFSGVADKIMGKFNDLEGVASGTSAKVGKALNGLMAGAGITALGASMMAPFNEAINVASEFNKTMSGLGAVADLDKTSQDFINLEDTAKRLGASTQFTSTQVAAGMKEMSMAGMSTKNVLSGIEGMLNLAATEGMELARASEIAGNSMNLFNIKAGDMYKVLDKSGQEHSISGTQMIADSFAKASTSYSLGVNDMGESIKYFAGAISTFNIPLNETTAMIGLLANKGFKGSVATASLSTALGNLTDKGKKATAAEFGLKFFDQKGKFVGMVGVLEELQRVTGSMTQVKKSELINRMFGADATKLIVSLLDASQEATDQFGNTKTLKGADALKYGAQKQMEIFGVSGQMAERMLDNLAGDKERMSSAWEGLMLTIGSALEPSIRKVVQFGTSITDMLNSIADSPFGTVLSHLLYFGGGLIATLGALTTGFYAFRLAQVALIPVMQMFGATSFMALLPLIKVLAVIALVAGAIYLLKKAFDVGKSSYEKYTSGFEDTSFIVRSGLIDPIFKLGTVLYKVFNPIVSFFESIKNTVGGLVAFDVFFDKITAFDNQIKSLTGSTTAIIDKQKYWNDIMNKMSNSAIFSFFMKFTGVLRGVWEVLKSVNTEGFTIPKDIYNMLENLGIADTVTNIGSWLVHGLNFVYGFIDGIAEGFGQVKDVFTVLWDNGIAPLWENLKNLLKQSDMFKDMFAAGKDTTATWKNVGQVIGKVVAYLFSFPIAALITYVVGRALALANAFMWVSNNIGWVNILKAGLIALGITLAPFIIATMAGLASLTVAFTLLAVVATAVIAIMLLPFIAIGAAIYAVYKAIQYLYNNWGRLGDVLSEKWEGFKNKIGSLGEYLAQKWDVLLIKLSVLVSKLSVPFIAFGNYISSLWDILITNLSAKWESLKAIFWGVIDSGINAFSTFGDMIISTLQPVWDFAMRIWNLFTTMPQNLLNIGTSVMTALGSALTAGWESLKMIILNLVKTLPFGEQLLNSMGIGEQTGVIGAGQTQGTIVPAQATKENNYMDNMLGYKQAQAEAFSPRVDNQISVQPTPMPELSVIMDGERVAKIITKKQNFANNTQ